MGRDLKNGHVEVRPNSIRIHFRYQGRAQKETLYIAGKPAAPTPANVNYALRLAKKICTEIRLGTFDYAEHFPHSPRAVVVAVVPSDAVMLHETMDRFARVNTLKASTRRQYAARIRTFWKNALTDRPIDQVRHSDILEALSTPEWSAKTFNNELSLINAFFEYAVNDKLITSSPSAGITRKKPQKPKPDPFSAEETDLIIKHLRKHRPGQILNFVQFMLFTGLRTSEGAALRWESIDFRKKEMLIAGGLVHDDETSSTKTSVARTVKLNSLAMDALERQKAYTFLQGEHVFHDPEYDAPWAYRRITDVRVFWKQTLKRIGIRYRRPYQMRHTYATMGLMSGAKPGFLARQLGHSLQMFFTVYADWINGKDDDDEMHMIEASIARKFPGSSPADELGSSARH